MDFYKFPQKYSMFIIVGCQDGFIKLSQKVKLKKIYWKTNRVFTSRVNGPISSLLFYVKPYLFDHYLLQYSQHSLCETTNISDNDDDECKGGDYEIMSALSSSSSNEDIEDEILSKLSLYISGCSGYCTIYDNIYNDGFMDTNLIFLNEHILYSIHCCDSILCSNYFIIKGYLFLLFGCYSGKLLCYKLNNIQNDINDTNDTNDNNDNNNNAVNNDNQFKLAFESQFDQQIHCIKCNVKEETASKAISHSYSTCK